MNPLELFKHAHNVKQFGPGDLIFAEGTQADGMYVILEGNVDIQIHGQTVNVLGPREIFGEMALIDEALRSASAIAWTRCRVSKADEKQFLFMVEQTPFFALHVMRVLVSRLRRVESKV